MIQTNNLTFQYKKGEQILSFPNITLDKQESLLVLGKSGIGKTTFLHLLAGLLKPTGGKVLISDIDLCSLSHNQLDKFRGQQIGLVFQKKYAIESLSLLENLKMRLYLSKKSIKDTHIKLLLEQLDLNDCKNKRVQALSEGQLQRLSIAMAVIHCPQVILADEPTSSLDDENCKNVIELLKQQARETKANLIIITHDHRIKPYFQKSITL